MEGEMAEETDAHRAHIPRDPGKDYTAEAAVRRRAFVEAETGAKLDHVGRYGFDPESLPGNIENFIGAAQVPIGLAGPLHVIGEHAQGEFYIPMATTEGTLVASYNRGMRLVGECGGARATVVARSMQRSPAFIFADALQARIFGEWVEENFAAIKAAAETTTRSGRLTSIQQFAVGPLLHLRFNLWTGDAAGQNMSGKATFAACEWIKAAYPGGARYILSGNTDTDKKHSQMNMLMTRGRRVVAEVTLKREALRGIMRVDPADLFYARQISQAGAFLAGSANNGAHAANGLAALFRTSPMSPNRTRESSTRSFSTTATTTGRSPCPR
jgi:hydroxymethylglutaryl-CoA reductase (NADPH)